MGIVTILWEKWREFLRDFSKITLAALIAPLMYLIVFGWGIRTTMNGQPYLYYLIPGVVSLTTMNGSFSAMRGLYSAGIILLLILPIHTGLVFNWQSFVILFLNGAVFAGLSIVVSFLAKNHADVPRFSNYIIMPMSYLCNTAWRARGDYSSAAVADQLDDSCDCNR